MDSRDTHTDVSENCHDECFKEFKTAIFAVDIHQILINAKIAGYFKEWQIRVLFSLKIVSQDNRSHMGNIFFSPKLSYFVNVGH